jgi:hypothetical protein
VRREEGDGKRGGEEERGGKEMGLGRGGAYESRKKEVGGGGLVGVWMKSKCTVHCKETIPKIRKLATNIPRNEFRSLSPNIHIHVSVSNLYIPTIGLPILLQENMWADPVQFLFWEYINGIFVAV